MLTTDAREDQSEYRWGEVEFKIRCLLSGLPMFIKCQSGATVDEIVVNAYAAASESCL